MNNNNNDKYNIVYFYNKYQIENKFFYLINNFIYLNQAVTFFKASNCLIATQVKL